MEHETTTTFCNCKLLRRREDRNWRNASYSTDAGKGKMGCKEKNGMQEAMV